MRGTERDRAGREELLPSFEREAELLVVSQLDLLAQLEQQLRAVHRTMRQIEKLRNPKNRRAGSSEVSNGERHTALSTLTDELTRIDAELKTQHQSCREMQRSIDHMQKLLAGWRQHAAAINEIRLSPEAEGPA